MPRIKAPHETLEGVSEGSNASHPVHHTASEAWPRDRSARNRFKAELGVANAGLTDAVRERFPCARRDPIYRVLLSKHDPVVGVAQPGAAARMQFLGLLSSCAHPRAVSREIRGDTGR